MSDYYREGEDRREPEFRSHLERLKRNCYLCDKPGHLAKACPDKNKK